MEFQHPWQQMETYHVDMETWKNQEDPMFNIDYWSLQSPLKEKALIQDGVSRESEVQAQEETGQADTELVETFLRNLQPISILLFV